MSGRVGVPFGLLCHPKYVVAFDVERSQESKEKESTRAMLGRTLLRAPCCLRCVPCFETGRRLQPRVSTQLRAQRVECWSACSSLVK
jgi:hypothetical protein